MRLRRKLFFILCTLTILWWLSAIFGGDGSLMLTKFQSGGWRGAFVVHFVLAVVIGLGVPLAILAIGRAAFWVVDRSREKTN